MIQHELPFIGSVIQKEGLTAVAIFWYNNEKDLMAHFSMILLKLLLHVKHEK